ncbi:hypothetical protein Indivirus_9_2 [Indivirus ILV1]|uniref:Uncharacterized protein n=1 Tax=Indivirus ILV1 TaxID=1977633 RepID=A0A1V0SE76_9VIRU|nr:hypothetical protein Indivirus_9_2 [Indivirus ILV1]
MSKICTGCKKEKPISEFHKKTVTRKGVKVMVPQPRCKECCLIIQREYRKKNAIAVKARAIIYRQKTKEHHSKVKKEWLKNNREKRNAYIRQYKKEKRLSDPRYKIYENTRKRIWKCMKNKSESSKSILGCTLDFYKEWLEYTFYDNMTWDNYGTEWHIDHVTPIKSFDEKTGVEYEKAFRWYNTRAMLVEDNLLKHDNIDEDIVIKHYEQLLEFNKIKEKQNMNGQSATKLPTKGEEGSTTR